MRLCMNTQHKCRLLDVVCYTVPICCPSLHFWHRHCSSGPMSLVTSNTTNITKVLFIHQVMH